MIFVSFTNHSAASVAFVAGHSQSGKAVNKGQRKRKRWNQGCVAFGTKDARINRDVDLKKYQDMLWYIDSIVINNEWYKYIYMYKSWYRVTYL